MTHASKATERDVTGIKENASRTTQWATTHSKDTKKQKEVKRQDPTNDAARHKHTKINTTQDTSKAKEFWQTKHDYAAPEKTRA